MEINISIKLDIYTFYWKYYYIEDGEMLELYPNTEPNKIRYTRQQVWDYHNTNSVNATILPDVLEAVFFKSLKSQIVADGALGLGASDWEAHD